MTEGQLLRGLLQLLRICEEELERNHNQDDLLRKPLISVGKSVIGLNLIAFLPCGKSARGSRENQ